MDNALRFKSQEIKVDKNNPWADDKLDRQKCADALTNFIDGLPDSLVLSLNGNWGSGKSFMLKRWKIDLEQKGFSAIYFNAWEDDYYKDPLIAIIGQLKEYMGQEWDSVTKYAAPILKAGANIAIKAFSCGTIDLNGVQTSQNVFDEYNDAKENIRKLKDGIIAAIKDTAAKDKSKKLPLVFIIDELDRCRPTFAIELLERIKHLFDMPDIVFVLGIDREQLGHSIKCVYGQDMNVEGYLHRLIDMNFILPNADPTMFCDHLFQHWGIEIYFRIKANRYRLHLEEFQRFKEAFKTLSIGFRLSLREIEHAIRIFALASKNLEDNHFMYPDLLVLLIFLKLKNSGLYCSFSKGQCSSFEILNYLFEQIPADKWNDWWFNTLEAHVYLTDLESWHNDKSLSSSQLHLLESGERLTSPFYVSKRTMSLKPEDIKQLVGLMERIKSSRSSQISKETRGYLTAKIELASLLLNPSQN